MKKLEIAAVRYALKKKFYVDVLTVGENVEFWLGHEECDVKEMMFAASAQLVSSDRYETMIEDNVEDYIEDFTEAYLEE